MPVGALRTGAHARVDRPVTTQPAAPDRRARALGAAGWRYRDSLRARLVLLLGILGIVGCGVVIAIALGWRDPAARRVLYDVFPVYPGAEEIAADAYRINTSEGWPTRSRGLRVTFSLPDDAVADDVLGFYRAHIPAGWSEASDQTCREILERIQAPPPMTRSDGATVPPEPTDVASYGLLQRGSRLTVFVPGETGTPDGSVEGVSLTLQRQGDRKFIVLDEPEFACGPPQEDAAAEAFNQ